MWLAFAYIIQLTPTFRSLISKLSFKYNEEIVFSPEKLNYSLFVSIILDCSILLHFHSLFYTFKYYFILKIFLTEL